MKQTIAKGGEVGARVSQEMKNAQSMLWAGSSGYAASKATGISESAISKSATCQDIMRAVRKATETLCTDRELSDDDLLDLFTRELCMPELHARAYIARRAEFLDAAGAGQ